MRHCRRIPKQRWTLGLPTCSVILCMISSYCWSVSALYTVGIQYGGILRSSNRISISVCQSAEAADRDIQRTSEVAGTPATSKTKLSRPERKALERQKKEEQKRFGKKKKATYNLHSENISQLTPESSAEDVIRAIKRAQNNHDHHDLKVIADFLINECDIGFAYGYRGSLLARLAVAALHFGNHHVARQAIDIRRLEYRPSMLPMESAAIIRGLLRVHNATDALAILFDELSLPLEGTDLTTPENKDRLKHRALSLASISSRNFFEGELIMAVSACQMLCDLGPIVREAKLTSEDLEMPWLRLIQGAAKSETARRTGTLKVEDTEVKIDLPCNVVYSVLNAMTTFPSDNNDLVYEAISNSLVRRVLFITGAVAMDGCPPADRGEAVFVGRSNVGKSSLVNMVRSGDYEASHCRLLSIHTGIESYSCTAMENLQITNRKSLAFTSKTPGKTQQFNYFAVNDKPGKEKEVRYGDDVSGEPDLDSFYIVDLPGFGFAKVPEKQRKEWSRFMAEYLSTRRTLRVVFHLVDGRHGPIDEDANIMRQVAESLPKNVAYVVVLTKADKNVKGASRKRPGQVPMDVMNTLRETMRANKVGNAPVIVTSAETKLGRDDLWRFLRRAAEL